MRSSARRLLSSVHPAATAATAATRAARFAPAVLSLAVLLTLLPGAAGAAGFSPEQRQEIEGIIKDYLTKNPELLLDVLQAAEDKAKSQSQEKAAAALVTRRQEVLDDPNSPISQNPVRNVPTIEPRAPRA